MNRYRMQFAPQVWTPKLNPRLVRWLRPWRLRHQIRTQQLIGVDLRGDQHVRAALAEGRGVMIMPNHSSHADPFTIYMAADAIETALHIMATWHVFHDKPRLTRWLLCRHGCFSVDREANDIRAFRQAVEILENRREPLVIFPEGEIYHCNDRVTPFREGAAAIAVAAARRAKREIVCIPCAISYRFVEDPTESLRTLMGELEEAILWRQQPQLPLHQRIYRFAEALLAVKELEYLGQSMNGPLPPRIQHLGEHILSSVEQRHGITPGGATVVPERIKGARKTIIERQIAAAEEGDLKTVATCEEDLNDLFIVVQSFSYPGDYVSEQPSVERMAETLDKFEEDVLRRPTASIRGKRRASVEFGEPVAVLSERGRKGLASSLTEQVENRVQAMLLGARREADSALSPRQSEYLLQNPTAAPRA